MIFSEQTTLIFLFMRKIMGSSSYFESYCVLFSNKLQLLFQQYQRNQMNTFCLRVGVMVHSL